MKTIDILIKFLEADGWEIQQKESRVIAEKSDYDVVTVDLTELAEILDTRV